MSTTLSPLYSKVWCKHSLSPGPPPVLHSSQPASLLPLSVNTLKNSATISAKHTSNFYCTPASSCSSCSLVPTRRICARPSRHLFSDSPLAKASLRQPFFCCARQHSAKQTQCKVILFPASTQCEEILYQAPRLCEAISAKHNQQQHEA